jgi:hypothetical protein
MRALAIVLALGHLVGCLVVAWFLWFLAVFPWENQTPESERWDPVLIGTAVAISVLATATLVAVAIGRRSLAIPVVVLDLGLGLAILVFALGASSHSDGRLLGFALLVELPAIASVALLERSSDRTALA